MKDKSSEYIANGGWSSALFAPQAIPLLGELKAANVPVVVGRTVIHIGEGRKKIKAYVHHNGRTEEYATITDCRGTELATFHYTDFHKLREFVLGELK